MKTFYSKLKITILLFEATDVVKTSESTVVGDGHNDYADPFNGKVFGGD